MVRKLRKTGSLKKRYFGELLTDKEIKKHAVKSNFGTQELEEIYQKELAGHIVNSFIKWSPKLDIAEDKMKGLSIVKEGSKGFWAKYDPRDKMWKFNLNMGSLPIDIIDYLVLEVLCHYYIIYNNVSFEDVMLKNMSDYKEKAARLEEIEALGEKWLTNADTL